MASAEKTHNGMSKHVRVDCDFRHAGSLCSALTKIMKPAITAWSQGISRVVKYVEITLEARVICEKNVRV